MSESGGGRYHLHYLRVVLTFSACVVLGFTSLWSSVSSTESIGLNSVPSPLGISRSKWASAKADSHFGSETADLRRLFPSLDRESLADSISSGQQSQTEFAQSRATVGFGVTQDAKDTFNYSKATVGFGVTRDSKDTFASTRATVGFGVTQNAKDSFAAARAAVGFGVTQNSKATFSFDRVSIGFGLTEGTRETFASARAAVGFKENTPSQPEGIVLDPNPTGVSRIYSPFDSAGWVITQGPGSPPTHVGDDRFARDWARPGMPTRGQKVYAAISGQIVLAREEKEFGKTVVIWDSRARFAVRYAHLNEFAVQSGQMVVGGQSVIGSVGSTGNSSGPHLHLAVYREVDNQKARPVTQISPRDDHFAADYLFTGPVRIVQADQSNAIYAIDGGRRFFVTDWVYANWGWALAAGLDRSFGPLEMASQNELNSIPDSGFFWPPRNGQLLKGDVKLTVYLIQERLKRGIPGSSVFNSCGFSLGDVISARQADVDRIAEGQVLTSCRPDVSPPDTGACVASGAGCLEPVDTEVLGERVPLILIHGWNPRGLPAPPLSESWNNFIQYTNGEPSLRERYKLYRFSYTSNSVSLFRLGFALRDVLDKISADDPANFGNKPVVILAHSMGGLIARYYMTLEHLKGAFAPREGGERVLRLITLGTPHHGTPLANGLAMERRTRLAWSFALENFYELLAAAKHVPAYNENNRIDLHWDNSDGLLNYERYPEYNLLLMYLNATTRYDDKIITYTGSTSPSGSCGFDFDNHEDLSCWGSTVLGGVLSLASDGVVPVKSAQFEDHVAPRNRRFQPGYDHSELVTGKEKAGGLDLALFDQIKKDLLSAAGR